MADIFISYSKAYRALTEALAKDLEARGHTVWWDTSLLSGETFRDVILRELDAAKAVIVIWSPASVKSDWVISEATRARVQGKLITVRSAKVQHGEIPPPFDVLHCDVVDERARIEAALAKFGVVASADRPPPPPKKPAKMPWEWIGAGAAAIAVIAAVYLGVQQKKPECTAADWGYIQKAERLATLRTFAADCKGNRYGELADEELGRRDKAVFAAAQAANTVAAYEAYLADWPQGSATGQARQRISAINAQEEAARRKAEEDRKRREEQLRREAEAAEQRKAEEQRREQDKRRLEAERRKADDAAWAKAEAGGAIADWRGYLAAFAQGEHSGEAGARIAAREKAERLVRAFTGHAYWVRSVTFSPDGRFALSGSFDNTLKLWDVSTGREVRAFTGHTDPVNSVAFSPDGRFALSGSWDTTLKLWDVSTGREVRAFTGHTSYVSSVTFSPDGRYALSGSYDKTLKLWDVSTGREVRAFTGHAYGVDSVAFSPDGRFALSGSYDKKLKLWDVSTGREVLAFTGHTSTVRSVTFSPDGRLALSGSDDRTLKLWDVSTGREVRAFTGHAGDVHSVGFSPDGRYVVSGAAASAETTPGGKRSEIKLWVASTGTLLHTFVAGSADVNSVAFSPDGRFVLSGSDDKTMKLWDVSEWTKPAVSAAQ